MATPNLSTITASIERSLQNCSLNQHHSGTSSNSGGGGGAHVSDSPENLSLGVVTDTATLELNSQSSLPSHWEQYLDLKTGEISFINWRTGMKAKEDPRSTAVFSGDYYSEDDTSSYDSEGSSSESSHSRQQWSGNINNQENFENSNNNNNSNNVLVVAGCKSCLMYYMVPKQHEICPKCCGQLLHFDRSENGSP